MNDTSQSKNSLRNDQDDKWLKIIEDWEQSGLSIAEWCRNHEEITYEQFRRQRRRLRPDDIRTSEFLKQETTWSKITMDLPSSSLDIIVNSCRIPVSPGFDQVLLREVVEVLKDVH